MTERQTQTIALAAEALRTRAVSSVDLVSACLGMMDASESTLRAMTTRLDTDALSAAAEADRRFASAAPLGPLDGIPIVVKDLIDIEGYPTTAGSRILADNIARRDATVVARLRAAGAILVGKTNTHEFALGAVTPPTKNPWDPTRMPGGSSGGSAVAVAAGMALGALGTDTAGSIREPACLCGICGLKPTFGRVSRSGVVPLAWSLDCVGPMARTPYDCLLLLRAIEGTDSHDPATASIENELARESDLEGLRIGVVTSLSSPLETDVRVGFDRLRLLLTSAGAHVTEVSLGDTDEILATTLVILAAEGAAYHRRWMRDVPDLYQKDVLWYLRFGAGISATEFIDAQRFRRIICERVTRVFNEVDLMLTPGQLCVAPRVEDGGAVFPEEVERYGDLTLVRPLVAFSLTGVPAVAVPLPTEAGGLPIGAQLVGPAFSDVWLLEVAAKLHDLVAWSWVDPPLRAYATDSARTISKTTPAV
jgi:aspartyl-tRNA(Asn)/glutamyl-tRNA(Gln) amidotransferase subunit A